MTIYKLGYDWALKCECDDCAALRDAAEEGRAPACPDCGDHWERYDVRGKGRDHEISWVQTCRCL